LKTNIAFYLMTGGDGMGGAWALFMEYLDWLDREHYSPIVFYYCENKETDIVRRNDLEKRNIEVIDLSEYGVPLDCVVGLKLPKFLKLIIETLRTAQYLKKKKLEVAHYVLGWYPSHQLLIIAGRLANIKVRLSDILLNPRKSHQGRKVQTVVNYLADKSPTHVRSMSQRDMRIIKANTFIDSSRVSWILPAVNVELYEGLQSRREELRNNLSINPDDRIFLALGRLAKIKAPLQYIESINQVAGLAREKNAKFLIAGDGSLREEMDKLIKRLDLYDIVFLLGYVENNAETMIAGDVFVNHSLAEGGPMTFLEALAAGKPGISTDVGFTTELIQETACGSTVPIGAVDAMANILREYMAKSESELSEMGKKGYLFAKQKLVSEKVQRRFHEIYLSGKI